MLTELCRNPMYLPLIATLAFLCFIAAPTAKAELADISDQMVMEIQVPADVKGRAFEQEVGLALKLGYMNLIGDSAFKPEGTVLAKDFISCVDRGLRNVGLSAAAQLPADDPEAEITRQQAVKLLVTGVLTADQIELIGRQCGGAYLYLSDFLDAGRVAPWAEPYFVAAVYKGWVQDTTRLLPDGLATREFAAAILARAFPDPAAYTGLVVYVDPAQLRRAQFIQIVSDGLGPATEVLYPDPKNMPSFAFLGTPGIASFCDSLDEAKERRVGANPLEVAAADVRQGAGGSLQFVLSPEDAMAVWGGDVMGLFRRTWRVAIVKANEGPTSNIEP